MAERKFKRDYFAELKELAEDAERTDLVEFINHEIELLSAKSSTKTPTKTQKENEGIKENILNALGNYEHPVTISTLMAENAEFADYSNQKMSALLKQLSDGGLVVKTMDKKRAYFAIAR